MKKNKLIGNVFTLVVGLAFFLSGCQSAPSAAFAYPPTRGGDALIDIVGTETTMSAQTIAILPVHDARNDQKDYEWYQLFAMLPLVPFSRGDNNCWATDTVNPTVFQNVIVSHIEKSRCATSYATTREKPLNGEYLLRPKIINGGLESYTSLYCLGIFPGCYLAILGVPFQYNWMTIEFEFELIAPDGRTLTVIREKGEKFFVAGEYYNWNPNTFLSLALCQSLNKAMPALNTCLKGRN